jgi:hypothetical protein
MKIITIFLAAIITSTALNASLRDLDYDDVRREGGFISETLVNVCRIGASKTNLTIDEKMALLSSPYLNSIHTLDLSGQDIDDAFVEKFASNQSLRRLITLDLSNNPSVTDDSIEYIRKSLVLGSVRDLPQVSARYGGPSTTVYVKCRNTAVTKTEVDPEFYFGINYINPVTGKKTFEHVDDGIKLISLDY